MGTQLGTQSVSMQPVGAEPVSVQPGMLSVGTLLVGMLLVMQLVGVQSVSALSVGVLSVSALSVGVLSVSMWSGMQSFKSMCVDVVCVRSEFIAESVTKSVAKYCGGKACVDASFNGLYSITYCL